MFEFLTADALVTLLTLTVLETFSASQHRVHLDPDRQLPGAAAARLTAGPGGAIVDRVALLFAINWVIGLTAPLFTVFGVTLSGRDLILLGGGLFLLYKATTEIHHRLEGDPADAADVKAPPSFTGVIIQILLLDIVFAGFRITAVGMADDLWVMVTAVIIAVLIMMIGLARSGSWRSIRR